MVWLIIVAIIAAIIWPPLRISSRLSREEEAEQDRMTKPALSGDNPARACQGNGATNSENVPEGESDRQ
jgi:hypothetical protein